MSLALNWTMGEPLRRRASDETRYAFPSGAHRGATLIAAGSPLLATLIVLSITLLPL